MAFDNRRQALAKNAARNFKGIGRDEFFNWARSQNKNATHEDINWAYDNYMTYAKNFRLGYYGNDLRWGY